MDNTVKQETKVQISSPKFRAVPVRNKSESMLSTVSTARKSFVKAKNVCPGCGIRVNRNEMGTCEGCGIQVCLKCLNGQRDKNGIGEGKCKS